MKALCFLIPLLLYIIKFICPHNLNVGSVLFTKSHLHKKCWTDSEIKLLYARQVMQGVLPDPDFIDITKSGTITVLLDYFQSCFEVISLSPCRKTHNLMYFALADALGGYLRTYILPLTKHGYYAGHIKYFEAKRAYQFYEELKEYLRTNGAGWAEPRMCKLNCKIKPLKISMKGCDTACSQLYLRDEVRADVKCNVQKDKQCATKKDPCMSLPDQCELQDKKRLINIIKGMRNWKDIELNDDTLNNIAVDLNGRNEQKIRKKGKLDKRRLRSYAKNSTLCAKENSERLNFYNSSFENLLEGKSLRKRYGCCDEGRLKKNQNRKRRLLVPLPVLDDPIAPSAIALPFKVRPLRNLCCPQAISILVRYYITVIRCLLSKSNNKCEFCNFNAQFQSWLIANVFPLLAEEEWYPAFGGVLRIDETIKLFGANTIKCKSICPSDIRYLFWNDHGVDESDSLENGERECPDMILPPCPRKEDGRFVTLGIIIMALIWILAFFYCICCYCTKTKYDKEAPENSSPEQANKKVDTGNSFIVQCLVKFFKRAEQEKKNTEPANEKVIYDTYYAKTVTGGERGQLSRRRSCERPIEDECRVMGSVPREDQRPRNMTQRETIVLPAQINTTKTDTSMEYNTIWPFTDFRNVQDIGKHHPDEGLKCLYSRKGSFSKFQRRKNAEQFQTLWKRKKSETRTSDSCEGLRNQNMIGSIQEGRRKRKADVLSKSSCSNIQSPGGFKCPVSYRYSYNSSSTSYSSSQAGYDISNDIFGQVTNCHNYFATKGRAESKKQKSESESERSITSSSYSEESFSSVNRIP